MRIPSQLIVPLHTLKTVDSYALIDSGADISCIDYDFVKKIDSPSRNSKSPSVLETPMNPSTRKEISYTPVPSSPTSKESPKR